MSLDRSFGVYYRCMVLKLLRLRASCMPYGGAADSKIVRLD